MASIKSWKKKTKFSYYKLLKRMPALRNLVLFAITFFISYGSVNAQLSSKDSSFLLTSVKNVLTFYDQNIEEQSGKFNGSQNIGYSNAILDKNPYYNSPNFGKGYIIYDHVFYNNVLLLFDEVTDIVILQDSSHKIELISEKLNSFGLFDTKFKYLTKNETTSSALLKNGYYQVLVDNKTSLFKKETKKINEQIIGNELNYQIEISTHYYILKDNQYHEVQSKKTIFRLFKEKEKEIKHFIKTQHLSYRHEKDNTLTDVVEYYNLLTK